MKRDLDLMRSMMLRIEEQTSGDIYLRRAAFDDLCENLDAISYHLRTLLDAGFIEALDLSSSSGEDYAVRGLTFAGCDYLDAIRDKSIWEKVKKKISSIGGSASVEIVKALAVSIARTSLGI